MLATTAFCTLEELDYRLHEEEVSASTECYMLCMWNRHVLAEVQQTL